MNSKQKICMKCNKIINEKKEKYTCVQDWNKGKKEGESWWHVECFKKAMNRNLTILEKQAAKMLEKAGGIFNNLPEEFKQEKYVI